MAKPSWGTKRLCQSCATKFYDFDRTPIACPKCGSEFDPEALLKSRRPRPAAKASKPTKPIKPALVVADDADEDLKIEIEVDEEGIADLPEGDEDEPVLEDGADLDEGDVATVVIAGDDDEAER